MAVVYGGVVRLRNWLYNRGVLRSVGLRARVISVGNVTVGGTGKTPLVEMLARFLRDEGRRVAVLSRGYGRKEKGIVVVSDGKEIRVNAEAAGDEPMLLARRLKGIPVLVGRDRAVTGRIAVESFGCNVLLLDDAFQHRRVKRDLDFVSIDSTNLWGNGRLLPAGPLRESLGALARADVVLFARCDASSDVEEAVKRVQRYKRAKILFAWHRPLEWVSALDGGEHSLDLLKGKRVVGFAGIGNPEAFRSTLRATGVDLVRLIKFKDHHWYNRGDFERIAGFVDASEAEAIVTTEKDSVRLSVPQAWEVPVYYLRIDFEIQGGFDALKQVIDSALNA